ncbi:MAG: adenylate/guanylate cyclase domain-containing protein [Sporichthyaceae bacterium]
MADCQSCGTANRDGRKFCAECGAALAVACPSCACVNEPGERFCGECGASLVAAAQEGQRKQVTVLFADVVGSMDLAERLDPDQLTEVMQGLFAVCREAVEAFGGTVDKFTGDGIMALFGAPVAQEDHARRACHAALRLVHEARRYALTLRRRNVELAVRVGLNSGEVVAGAVGEAFTAVGYTVGLAQRMESLAEPGSVRLSERTAELIGSAFALRDLGEALVKGSSVPVRQFALDAAMGGASASGRRRIGSGRMVGRDGELGVLANALSEAGSGRLSIVGIVAEAGTGKSRLCEEFAARAVAAGATVRRTAGVSHAQQVPLLPILGLMRDYYRIAEADRPAEIRGKVEQRLLALDPALANDLPLVFDFMEVPDPDRPAPQLGPEARRRRILELFAHVATRRSERQTLLLILEDLHWFDPHSIAFLSDWLASLSGTRTLVVTNFRPEFETPWADRADYVRVPLAPLDDRAGAELLAELLGADPDLAGLSVDLLERAGGNPLFVEEIVRGLSAEGTLAGAPGAYALARAADSVRIPASVQAVLAARIDRLPGAQRSLLQAAAVVGRTFSVSVLSPVHGIEAEAASVMLAELCRAELLQPTEVADEFRFWHPLTQEVAYGSLLGAARRRLHTRVAETLLTTSRDRHDALAALVATHYEAADDRVEAARWQLRAASWAVRSDLVEAKRRLLVAVEHLAVVPRSPDSMALNAKAHIELLRAGARAGSTAEDRERVFERGLPLVNEIADPETFVFWYGADGVARLLAGDATGAKCSWLTARDWADRTDDRALRAYLWAMSVGAYVHAGPLGDGFEAFATTMELCGNDPDLVVPVLGFSAHDLGHLFHLLLCVLAGRLTDATRLAPEVLGYYAVRPVGEFRAWAQCAIADIAHWTGDATLTEAAVAAAADALKFGLDSGNVATEVRARHAAGVAAMSSGDLDRAEAEFQRALETARDRGTGLDSHVQVLSSLATARLARGAYSAARALADEAVVVARGQQAPVLECLAELTVAQISRATGENDAGLAAVDAGVQLAETTGAATYAAFLAEEHARLTGAIDSLQRCAAGYDEIGATGHAARLRAELA